MQRLFALIQSRGPAWNHSAPIEAQPEWTAHAAFMDRLTNEGFIVVGGPLEGSSDVLLILRASDEREIEQRLAADVWRRNGLLVAKGCWPWSIRLGSLDGADRADRHWNGETMTSSKKARAIGFNHVALEVGDIDEALAFYGGLFDFNLRSKDAESAFIDLGDQFIALQKGRRQAVDDGRHFGLVVDDKAAVRDALAAQGIPTLAGPFLDFLDPWGNRIEIVSYENVQFSKAPNVLRGMGLEHLAKNQQATSELADKGMAPESADMNRKVVQ
jgi:lactoylglutathione lyase